MPMVSFEVLANSRLLTGFTGLVLILLSFGLLKRKRTAWLLTVIVLAVGTVTQLLVRQSFAAAAFDLFLLLLLLLKWRHYVVPTSTTALRRALIALSAVGLLSSLYGVIGLAYLGGFSGEETIWIYFTETWRTVLQTPREVFDPVSRWFFQSLRLSFLAGLLFALIYALSPNALKTIAPLEDKMRAESLVFSYGRSSLAHFTLLGDKHYYFTPDDQAFVAYTVEQGVGLALGDPIGEPAALSAAISGFEAHCEKNGWKAAFYQVLPDHLSLYKAAGFYSLAIGQEAVVDLEKFSKSGKAGKNFRAATNQLVKAGYQARIYRPPHSDERLAELRAVSDTWLADKRGAEKSFSLGKFDDDYLRRALLIILENSTGKAVAFANLVDEFQKNELTLDLMRSLSGLPEDSMLYLFIEMLEYAKAQGYESFNLGLAALSGLRNSKDAPFEERILATVFERFNQFYNFKGLYHFKGKLHPRWEMRYLIYPKRQDILSVLSAVALADSSLGLWGEVKQEVQRRLAERKEKEPKKLVKTPSPEKFSEDG